MVSLSLLSSSLLLLLSTAVAQDKAMNRETRAFPYSVSFVRLLNPEGQLYPSAYYDELSQMIDSLNKPAVYNRQRRDMAEPVKSKRYACRFKFCRIFDA
ncbi:hypothetical protein PENTCL1PPCAC_18270 [Pristionchus entomophagus]|uniref:Uncharacterized protein n=1 Tax=Pristionchus entomophagus TaxID=358040 RepID=A0AAV5TNU4_9BILA|nr:hypothetical protein PENTCL1PPCAC_18270 [Pristionchus entomophagus]